MLKRGFHFKLWIRKNLPKRKKKKVIGLMKNGLGGKIMREFAALRAKAYNYLTNDGSEDLKKKKRQKKVCHKNKN